MNRSLELEGIDRIDRVERSDHPGSSVVEECEWNEVKRQRLHTRTSVIDIECIQSGAVSKDRVCRLRTVSVELTAKPGPICLKKQTLSLFSALCLIPISAISGLSLMRLVGGASAGSFRSSEAHEHTACESLRCSGICLFFGK